MTSPHPSAWLGLAPDPWPPDHYTLLGLRRGESDRQLIEHHALERCARVRCHQLRNPESASAALTLLARAMDCLTHPDLKRAYDTQVLGITAPAVPAPELGQPKPEPPAQLAKTPTPAPRPPSPSETAVVPPPVRRPKSLTATPPPAPAVPVPAVPVSPASSAPTSKPASDPELEDLEELLYGPWPGLPGSAPAHLGGLKDVDWAKPTPPAPLAGKAPPAAVTPAAVAPPASPCGDIPEVPFSPRGLGDGPLARRGLSSPRALLDRILLTRVLLGAWRQVGEYLGDPQRRPPTRKSSRLQFVRRMVDIRDGVPDFPLLGGHGRAGSNLRPGYYVFMVASQSDPLKVFFELLPSHREVLARDWKSSLLILEEHYAFLRRELRVLRGVGRGGNRVRGKVRMARRLRVLRSWGTDHPFLLLILAGGIGLAVAAWAVVTGLR